MNPKRAYKILLHLYPRDYRALFAVEMLAALEEAARERRKRGPIHLIRFAVVEVLGLLAGATTEWAAKLAYSIYHTNSYVCRRGSRDPRLMRPAGVSWESFYGAGRGRAQTIGRAGDSTACVNAHQNFVFGSHLRRLVMFAHGACCRCTCPAATGGSYLGRRD